MDIFGTYQETQEIYGISKFHTLRHMLGLRVGLADKVFAVFLLCKNQAPWYMYIPPDFDKSLQADPRRSQG